MAEPYTCKVCGEKFERLEDLTRHAEEKHPGPAALSR
jgi:C2H2 type zinc finger protein